MIPRKHVISDNAKNLQERVTKMRRFASSSRGTQGFDREKREFGVMKYVRADCEEYFRSLFSYHVIYVLRFGHKRDKIQIYYFYILFIYIY